MSDDTPTLQQHEDSQPRPHDPLLHQKWITSKRLVRERPIEVVLPAHVSDVGIHPFPIMLNPRAVRFEDQGEGKLRQRLQKPRSGMKSVREDHRRNGDIQRIGKPIDVYLIGCGRVPLVITG